MVKAVNNCEIQPNHLPVSSSGKIKQNESNFLESTSEIFINFSMDDNKVKFATEPTSSLVEK